ncbi:hypothetical protein K491DRAFT_700446 [Lophiostoma macrostomum CBS 122681]|uniref:Xylanolytic transcriptional activator regulatory domain-containing protein n=1 Tax=Lophiostoma macrostomum CBS 122681 TaxID=1314788 RepID=A0A6A6TS08_9PLEO|nr:hypothetical protein K491DRAFT_700446 [Lophiostoma macrostomum CBS 122681]
MQGPKESRSSTSCTECQRRKQKLASVPANGPATIVSPGKFLTCVNLARRRCNKSHRPPQLGIESRGYKRSLGEVQHSEESDISGNGALDGLEDGLKAWGYMPGHVHYKLGQENEESRHTSRSESEQSQEVGKVLHAIPPRSITDALVNHFLSVVNYRYNAIYAPTFTEKYVQWWSDRAKGNKLSPEFTCLLLRVVAYSVQYLTPSLGKMIEFELACSSQTLAERFGYAAEQLSASFLASKTSLERVQEIFLKGAWLKSESRIVEAWHSLSHTIREAQELGIDKDNSPENLSEFELEIRRRLWTLLYIWDWQMSAWLGRPHLIDQKDCTFEFPNLRLDEPTFEPNMLSPFAHISLQAMLARRISQQMGDIQVVGDQPAEKVFAVEAECEAFIEELPPIFRLKSPDLSLDEKYPYFIFQRRQLHVAIIMTQLDFLKPYLTRSPEDPISSHDDEFRFMGVDLSLRLLEVARALFDHEFPINAKFHLVVFCIFDTATILCSAIIHDQNNSLPRRDEVMDAVEKALDMLHQLSLTTKIGASSYSFLFKLVQATPILSRYQLIRKRRRTRLEENLLAETPTPEMLRITAATESFADTVGKNAFTTLEPIPLGPTTDDLSFDVEEFLQQNPFGDSSSIEIGGLEQIWDIDSLNLDAFLYQDPTVSRL